MTEHARPGLVSIVLATNRDSPFLAQALDSVVSQNYQYWELVVVDNGVPNKPRLRDLLSRVPGSVLLTTGPATVSTSRNIGVAASTGDLLVFHDDDDVWLPGRLTRQVRSLEGAPLAPASYTGGWHLDAQGEPFGPAWPAEPATAAQMLSGTRPLPHICGAMMIRRAAFCAVGGFSPEMVMMEDFELAIRLLQRGTFACAPGEVIGYRRHDGNTTNTTLANVRVRRAAIEQVLTRQIWAAQVRGDARAASLLRKHLRSFRATAGAEAGRAALTGARNGRWGTALGEAWWSLPRSSRHFVTAMAQRLVTRADPA